jgi:hypothetical protein
VAVALAGILGAWLTVISIHPFLAVTSRANADVLVVEGWVHEFAIRAGVEEFKQGAYPRVYTTGGPVTGNGGYTHDLDTAASVGASLLRSAGLASNLVQMVPSRDLGSDRTYLAAVALREWFREHSVPVRNLNILTEDCHARRTRLLFQKAFGKQVTVGIIAVQNPDYDGKRWWRYSEGVREVMGESIAYVYARFFFHVPPATRQSQVAGDSRPR